MNKVNNPETLKKVISNIERNYNTILGINNDTDIYTLGAYIPKSLQSEEMNIFKDLIIAYNEKLQSLCKEYNITYIDTEEVGKKYNKSENNFHISTEGHNALANYILGCMYYNKFESGPKIKNNNSQIEILDDGVKGVLNSVIKDYNKRYNDSLVLSRYSKERALAIADEHKRETKIFQKIMNKKIKM